MIMCIQNMVKFCSLILKILNGNEILTSTEGYNSVANVQKKIVLYNPNPRGGGGVLLMFYIYIGLADFWGVKILKFSIFLGFQKNHYFFG